jgi:hypothetical protein
VIVPRRSSMVSGPCGRRGRQRGDARGGPAFVAERYFCFGDEADETVGHSESDPLQWPGATVHGINDPIRCHVSVAP